ncbi:hypothetical protein SAMN05518865_108104 [Duganella sp. CF458]|uniref:DUF6484 domain-containing protein n=1 Tax=Duganella sp. CF458 TaxID=1884368 RepID=UPI0008F01364|nr:DUF6484 domain-containing protein [Duganella sp. CF458]SFG09582.1 hypothetical protein SAMN05518865_108104 [Duganella sp. CF458]
MSGRDVIAGELMARESGASGAHALRPQAGVVIGELIGMADDGRTPLVLYPGQAGSAAMRARSVIDLRAHQVGSEVVLVFAAGDPAQPIIMGLLRGSEGWPLDEQPGQVEVDADGERLIVSAKEELVLRCGKASITLTRAGKVLIRGSYILSRSSGANHVKGGSVHLN